MGCFTWTDAAVKNPQLNKYDNYKQKDVIGYDGPATVVCPDNTCIREKCYGGYGIFGGMDAYELVAEWNKDHMSEIMDGLSKTKEGIFYGEPMRQIAVAYETGGETAALEKARELTEKECEKGTFGEGCMEWKRTLGIAISCGESNAWLPYPLKITKRKRGLDYAKLYPSMSTQ